MDAAIHTIARLRLPRMTAMKRSLLVVPAKFRGLLRRRAQPTWVPPMLATLTKKPFSDPRWIFECKLDGVRCLAFRKGKSVQLMSRNQKNLNRAFPELAEALQQQKSDEFIIDGEIVAFTPGSKVTSFGQIQQRLGINEFARARIMQDKVPAYLFLFDILHLDQFDLTGLTLLERKKILAKAIQFGGRLHISEHLKEHGEQFHKRACEQGWEGLIAKRADSRYVPGRSTDWLKLKCGNEQEFVIGGYTDPQQSRIGFGSLLVGYYDKTGGLRFAGGVGTGFSDQLLREMHARLKKIARKTSPFAEKISARHINKANWVEPKLVAQVGFAEWTRDGRLRQPRFLGLRFDKPAQEVVRAD